MGRNIIDIKLHEIQTSKIVFERQGSLHDIPIEKVKRILTYEYVITFDDGKPIYKSFINPLWLMGLEGAHGPELCFNNPDGGNCIINLKKYKPLHAFWHVVEESHMVEICSSDTESDYEIRSDRGLCGPRGDPGA